MPCTAHTTGFHTCCHLGLSSSPGSSWFQTSSGCPYGLLVSSPAQNARSPAARTTTAWTAGSSFTMRQAARISLHMVRSNALRTSGRFSVIVATWSSDVSKRIVSKFMLMLMLMRLRPPALHHDNSSLRHPGLRAAAGPSAAPPDWITLLVERLRSFVRIVRAYDALAKGLGHDLGFVEREVATLADREARAAHGERRIAVHDPGDLSRALEQTIVLDHLGHEPELVGPLRAHALMAARERQAHGDVRGERTRQPNHLTTGHQPNADVGVEELGPLGRNDDVAGRHEVETRATAQAVDRGEDRLGHRPERRRRLLRRFPLLVGRQVR